MNDTTAYILHALIIAALAIAAAFYVASGFVAAGARVEAISAGLLRQAPVEASGAAVRP